MWKSVKAYDANYSYDWYFGKQSLDAITPELKADYRNIENTLQVIENRLQIKTKQF